MVTIDFCNGVAASDSTADPLQSMSMMLPLSDPFHFVLACVQCIKLSNWPHYQKLQQEHECLKDTLLVKPVGGAGGSNRKYTAGSIPALYKSHRLPADIANVGPKGWLLVRPRPQIMHSQAGKVFGGNFKLCERVTLNNSKCRYGGISISDTIFSILEFLLIIL